MPPLKKSLPIFEVSTAFYYLYCSIIMFVYPKLIGSDQSEFYKALANILSPHTWAYVVFTIAIVLCYGLYSNRTAVRTCGLLMAAFVYLIFAISFARSFPNFATGLYVILATASIGAIATIKRTEL